MSLGPAWSSTYELGYIARPYLSKEEGKEMKGKGGGRVLTLFLIKCIANICLIHMVCPYGNSPDYWCSLILNNL